MADFESRIEALCNVIVSSDAELWDARNKAILEITTLVSRYEGCDQNRIQEVFTQNVFRLLKEPIKMMVLDLRSQQVRDTCLLLSKISEVTKDHMRLLLRDIFVSLVDGIKVPNRLMSGYVDTVIMTIINNTTYKGCIPLLATEIRESKSKLVRERCMEYLNEIFIHWDISEKDADAVLDTIRVTLEDASVRAREIARLAYLNLYAIYPKKTEKIKNNLPNSLRVRMTKFEAECVKKLSLEGGQSQVTAVAQLAAAAVPSSPLSSGSSAAASNSTTPRFSTRKTASSGSATTLNAAAAASAVAAAASISMSSPSRRALSSSPSHRFSFDFDDDDTGNHKLTGGPGRHSILALRAPRPTCEEGAVTSIQAIIRGKLTRRQTMVMQSIGEEGEGQHDGEGGGDREDVGPKKGVVRRATITPLSPIKKASFHINSSTTGGVDAAHAASVHAASANGSPIVHHQIHNSAAAVSPHRMTSASSKSYGEAATLMPPPPPSVTSSLLSSRTTQQKKQLTMLLKKKVAHTMKKLELQMNLVNELEGSTKQHHYHHQQQSTGDDGTKLEGVHTDAHLSKQVRELLKVVGEEAEICREFEVRLQALL